MNGDWTSYQCPDPECGCRFLVFTDGVDTPLLSCPWCEAPTTRRDYVRTP